MARIALITTSYPRSAGDPAGHFVRAEARALTEEGHTVTVLAPGKHAGPSASIRVVGLPDGNCFGWPGAMVRLRQDPWRALGAARFVAHARRALEREGPFDRVIAHFIVPCAWPIAMEAGGSLEVVGHGSDVRLFAQLPARRRIVRRLLTRGARFRFSSHELRDAFVRATLPEASAASRIELPSLELPVRPARARARSDLGIAPDARVSVIVGRLVRDKRIEAALEYAVEDRASIVAVIGDGPELARLRLLFEDVTFLGRLNREQTLTWIAAADRLVHASRKEGAPTAVREARALGVCVVAVPAGDLPLWAAKDPGLILRPELDETAA